MLHSTVVSLSPKALQFSFGFSSFVATNHNQSRRRRTRDGSVRGGVKTSNSNRWRQSMFVSTKPVLEDTILSVSGQDVLTDVPPNVVFTPIPNSSAAFLGATSQNAASQSRHVFKLGVLRYAYIYVLNIHLFIMMLFLYCSILQFVTLKPCLSFCPCMDHVYLAS